MNQAPPNRIVGIDLARGLAVLGMFGAHVAATAPFDWGDPETWSDVVNGRSSILFALLAGVSLAIISGGRDPVRGRALAGAMVRIATRAALILLLGLILIAFGTNVAVILTYYAVVFLLALPFLRWPPWALLPVAAALAIAMPLLVQMLVAELGDPFEPGPGAIVVDLFVTGYYPALIWIAFVLAGMAIGRLHLASTVVQFRMLVAGVALAAIGYGSGEYAASAPAPAILPFEWTAVATTAPHSGSPFEVVGSAGFAMAVLALCLMVGQAVGRGIRTLVFPVAAVGAMALTAYCAQIVAIAVLRVPVPGEGNSGVWLWFTLAALVGCSIWVAFLGRGPLERLLTSASRAVARLVPAARLDSASGPAVPSPAEPPSPPKENQ